ncbi:uncharacterized protein LOC114931292 [Nylanderia fulva]|uniref:uncharacterized protein LOC114931292 n=1 Tax=Nylanderia fulva TaxID=613905 RepID=UPI0010FB2AF9|nr:uncharacterized protein LOC114931292 [Nylanderia fulva]
MSNQCHLDTFYDKCMYKNCTSSRSLEKRIYRFPLQTDNRYHLWISNSGNWRENIGILSVDKTSNTDDDIVDADINDVGRNCVNSGIGDIGINDVINYDVGGGIDIDTGIGTSIGIDTGASTGTSISTSTDIGTGVDINGNTGTREGTGTSVNGGVNANSIK